MSVPVRGELPVLENETPGKEKLNMMALAAFHEVCHCMVAEQSGLRTSDMKIRRRFFGSVSGCTSLDLASTPGVYIDPDDPRMYHVEPEHVHAYLLCCVAGWRGVAAWFRDIQGTEEAICAVSPDWGCGDDFREFDCVSRGERVALSRSRAAAEADSLIRMHWRRITASTEQLYARKRLNATKVVSKTDRTRAAIKAPAPDAKPVNHW